MPSDALHIVPRFNNAGIGVIYTCKYLISHIVNILNVIRRIDILDRINVSAPAGGGGCRTVGGRWWFYTPLRDFNAISTSYDIVIKRYRLVCAGNPALRERGQAALSTKRLLLVSGPGGRLGYSSHRLEYGGFKACGVNARRWSGTALAGLVDRQ
jgi:hypothetical protein